MPYLNNHFFQLIKHIKTKTYNTYGRKITSRALIAQLVERKAFNLVAVGSSPTESESIYFYKII